jgi:hypothetical protein
MSIRSFDCLNLLANELSTVLQKILRVAFSKSLWGCYGSGLAMKKTFEEDLRYLGLQLINFTRIKYVIVDPVLVHQLTLKQCRIEAGLGPKKLEKTSRSDEIGAIGQICKLNVSGIGAL